MQRRALDASVTRRRPVPDEMTQRLTASRMDGLDRERVERPEAALGKSKYLWPPNQPRAMSPASRIADQTPASEVANLSDTLLSQIEATIGATPSIRLGTTISHIQATASFGMLISASRLPASDSSERRLVLDASSSMSPRRGSIFGLKSSIRGAAPFKPCLRQATRHSLALPTSNFPATKWIF